MMRSPDRLQPDAVDIDAPVPVACTLPAPALARRLIDLLSLFARADRARRLDDGLLVEFTSPTQETLRTVCDLLLAERQCCPRFTYELAFAPRLGPVTVRIRATTSDLASLRAVFGAVVGDAGVDNDHPFTI